MTAKKSNQTGPRSSNHAIWDVVGRILFFITWPGIWLMVTLSRERTRVVVYSEGRVLIARDWLGSGQWSLPGGGLRRGEDPKQGAVRELKEEVELSISANRLQSLGRFKIKSNGINTRYIAYALQYNARPEVATSTKEIAEVKWINTDVINDTSNPANLSRSAIEILQAFSKSYNLLK